MMGAADKPFQKVDIYGTEDGPAFERPPAWRDMKVSMHQCQAAEKLAELLRASLTEVLDAANVCGRRPIKVAPRTFQQVHSILRVCDSHKVGWSLESGSKMDEGADPGEVDVVVSLALLTTSNDTARPCLC